MLFHPRSEVLVTWVAPGCFFLAVGPLGWREASTSHYRLSAAPVADHAKAQLSTGRVRNGLWNYGWCVTGDAELFENLAPFIGSS